MFDSVSNKRLDEIIEITEKLEGSGLEKEVIDSIDGELTDIADYLGVSKECALFFSVIFVLQNRDFQQVSLHDIAGFMDFQFIHLLGFRSCLNQLEDAGLISLKEVRNSSPHSENNGYNISGTIMNCIIDGVDIVKIPAKVETVDTVLDEILRIQGVFSQNNMSPVEYQMQIETCEKSHSDNVMIKNIKNMFPDDLDSRLILYNLLCSNVMGQDFSVNSNDEDITEGSLYSIIPRMNRTKRRNSLREGTDILIEKKIIRKNFNTVEEFRGKVRYVLNYVVTSEGIKKIFGDEAEKYDSCQDEITEMDLSLQAIHEIAGEFENRRTGPKIKRNRIQSIENRNKNLPFFNQILKSPLKPDSRFILYDCINDYISGTSSSVSITISDLYGRSQEYFDVVKELLEEKHQLLEENFLDLTKEDVVERSCVSVTDKTLEFLYGKNAGLYKKASSAKNVYLPEKIKEKKLFYSKEIQAQIDMLSESLEKENFEAMQKRLEAKGLCKGVAVILYGGPGTGKTESVYQIAKKTGRQIMHVDIADSKSMWFGESEKQIKKIFTKYRILCKTCRSHNENAPILLFNEADAIISKRKDIENSSVGQTENAMQNILLEEMEKLDGILIATTNLCENMDKAFERRFLFKIKFEKPTEEARQLIWKDKMPELDEDSVKKLAGAYDFSGGEIDNIVRKCEMNEIIKGQKPDYELIKDFCSKERLEREENHHLGFEM